jgi:hypothetical protein
MDFPVNFFFFFYEETQNNNTDSFVTIFFIEEFGIYLQYVRKLGFEETPDYDFLRELFTKVIKNLGQVEDDMYDWCLLNNGKGWEVRFDIPS